MLDLNLIRSQFSALDRPAIFFDSPGGTQIAHTSLERIEQYLIGTNANHGGAFATSRQSDATVQQVRAAMADFLHAARPEEIVFGLNMTSLTYNLSRALAKTFQPGDTLVVTRMDHDANVSPWLQVAEDRGCRVRWVDFHPEDGTLDMADLEAALAEKPRLLAVGYASNALGTINPIPKIVEMAHTTGALAYIDAVQYAPHGAIDVQQLGCDFLVCSAYKFFGPHLGVLYGRYELLDALTAYRVRPAPAYAPDKFETGTPAFESIAGLLGALDYFESIGQRFGQEYAEVYAGRYQGRALLYKQAMAAIHAYELELMRALLAALRGIPGICLYGLTDERRLEQRVPTFSFTLEGASPLAVADWLGQKGIYVWDGNFYAYGVTRRLGLENQGGLVRVGAVHYNTLDEVHRLEEALHQFVSERE